ncbi:MAG TPA: fibronectin type III domain-containing protein [Gemmatimonadales bacterium]
MLHTKIMVLAATLVAGAGAPLYAQVDKPRTSGTATSTERLPAPTKVTATQVPGGPIQVSWSAVDGAQRYSLTRSVPPDAATSVTLPNPADTFYIDRDVQPTKTYYYLVAAINEAGITGLKASAPPVTARAAAPQPPSGVRAVLNGQTVTLTWSSDPSFRFIIERGEVTETQPSGWVKLTERSCCTGSDILQARPAGTRVVYRVRAVNSFGDWSEPAMSNEIVIPALAGGDSAAGGNPPGDTTSVATRVLPPVVAPPGKVRVGGPVLNLGTIPAFTGLRLQSPRWVSLNQAIATVTSDGRVRGRSAGFTYIVVNGVTPAGAVASMVARVDVAAGT